MKNISWSNPFIVADQVKWLAGLDPPNEFCSASRTNRTTTFCSLRGRLTSGSMIRAETTRITLDGIEYDLVLHVYGERDWRGFLIKPGSQVRIPERGSSKEEVLEKLAAALKEGLHPQA